MAFVCQPSTVALCLCASTSSQLLGTRACVSRYPGRTRGRRRRTLSLGARLPDPRESNAYDDTPAFIDTQFDFPISSSLVRFIALASLEDYSRFHIHFTFLSVGGSSELGCRRYYTHHSFPTFYAELRAQRHHGYQFYGG